GPTNASHSASGDSAKPARREAEAQRCLMPLYRNPDFRRLPNGLASVFDTGVRDSFFGLPAWYDLMARHGVPVGTEIRVYTDERQGSSTALLLQASPGDPKRR